MKVPFLNSQNAHWQYVSVATFKIKVQKSEVSERLPVTAVLPPDWSKPSGKRKKACDVMKVSVETKRPR